ncbi:MAG: hypothetical protein NVS3B21_31940 [Acidimicrobiales bacterium]
MPGPPPRIQLIPTGSSIVALSRTQPKKLDDAPRALASAIFMGKNEGRGL